MIPTKNSRIKLNKNTIKELNDIISLNEYLLKVYQNEEHKVYEYIHTSMAES
jgi:hypothetical protein